jgi:hypothetical protein
VVENFHSDLSSGSAQKIHSQLCDLNLPTLHDVKDKFDRLADKLGVGH